MKELIESLIAAKQWRMRILYVSLFILALCLIDTFTTYPSMSFTKEKYEAISAIAQVQTDTSIPEQIRKQASLDLKRMANRTSLFSIRENLSEFKSEGKWFKVFRPNIPWVFNEGAANMIISLFIGFLYLIITSGSFIALAFTIYTNGHLKMTEKKDYNPKWQKGFCYYMIVGVISFLLITPVVREMNLLGTIIISLTMQTILFFLSFIPLSIIDKNVFPDDNTVLYEEHMAIKKANEEYKDKH